ncbi:hypothetical protein AgCh_004235 [Apium graveolens]
MSEDHKLPENSTQTHGDHILQIKHEDHSHEPEDKIEENFVKKDHVEEEKEGLERSKTDDDCRTPCLEENKIPGCQSCPPAPSRKRTEEQVGLSHKRKLFFENTVGGAEEVESLFENSSSTVNEVSGVSVTVKKKRKR